MIKNKVKFQLLLFISIATISCGCLVPEKTKSADADSTQVSNKEVDNSLAIQLGEDNFGMKNYIMAYLKKGRKRWMIDSATANKLHKEHLENFKRLADEGKVINIGTFQENTDYKGIYIFNVKTIEEAQTISGTDPAIRAESLALEFHSWYGSAALLKVPEIHAKLVKKVE